MIRRLPARIALITATTMVLLILPACDSGQRAAKPGQEIVDTGEAKHTAEMIAAIKNISLTSAENGPIKRFNQGKTLGCFDGTFTVADNLSAELKQGIFARQGVYSAQLRFANATSQDDTDKDFRGVSIKLKGIEGKSLWGKDGEQDFLLNSYPALFAANPEDFLAFITATGKGRIWQYFIHPGHFYSLPVVWKGRAKIHDPFAISYWSTTPYRFGEDKTRAVKYSLKPCAPTVATGTVTPHKDFLAEAMDENLGRSAVCFDFMVQFQTDPAAMPIEDASVVWSESLSPFIKVATVDIPQGPTSQATRQNCEAMTFNPWQTIAPHRPLGGINRVRLAIYSEIGEFRRSENEKRGFP